MRVFLAYHYIWPYDNDVIGVYKSLEGAKRGIREYINECHAECLNKPWEDWVVSKGHYHLWSVELERQNEECYVRVWKVEE